MPPDLILPDDVQREPSIVTVDRAVAVLNVKVETLTKGFDSLERKLDVALQMFATKEELRAVVSTYEDKLKVQSERVAKVETNITWGVRTVVGAVIMAVIGAVLIIGRH